MSEKIEKIMKRIHVFFSNCDVLEGSDDRYIVPRKPMINLLEELNIAVYEVMEQYELTVTSRERELRRHNQKAEAIIEKADDTAEDIYAASMIYTDRVLIELRDMIDQAGKELKKEYDFLSGQLASQIDMVTTNQKEIRDYLGYTKQSNKYMDIISKYNDRVLKERKEASESAAQGETELVQEIKDRAVKKDKYIDKAVDKENAKQELADKQKPIKKVASVVDSSALSEEIQEDTVKRVSYEIKVNPMFYQDEADISPEALDAEYEKWKTAGEAAEDNQEDQKKDKKKVFNKKKKKRY